MFFRILLAIFLFSSAWLFTPGDLVARPQYQPPITDPPAAPPKSDTDSFMGMPVGSHVRVTCTAPAIELNNARLLAISKTTITVTSVTGERYVLPRESTEVTDPVNWKRTTGMVNQPPPPPKHTAGWIWLPLFLLAAAGFAGWLWVVRKSDGEGKDGLPVAGPSRKTGSIKVRSARGRLVLSAPPGAAGGHMNMAAAPMPSRPAPPAAPSGGASEGIEDLIESRCYGTAIEKLEQQIKQRPDDFKPRLQLLKIYVIIDNRKQVDRVLHQIEFHQRLTADQKQEARACLPGNGKSNEARERNATPAPAPTPTPSTTPVPATSPAPEAQPMASTQVADPNPSTPETPAAAPVTESKPVAPTSADDTKPAAKPATRHAVIAPKPDAKTIAEAAARFGLNPATVNVSATAPKPDAKPEAKIAETESKSDAGTSAQGTPKTSAKSAKLKSRSKSKISESDDASAPPAETPSAT
jgi:hypothetical protein